jgi:2'-5' RNA ligase
MHVTLGKFRGERARRNLCRAGFAGIAGLELAPFEVVFDQIGGFSSGNVVLQGRDGLQALKAFRRLCARLWPGKSWIRECFASSRRT